MEHTKPSKSRKQRIPSAIFEIPVNSKTYAVTATPFADASGEIFYRISYNNGPVHVFGWDKGLDRFGETDNMADVIPPVLEIAIAGKLHQYSSQLQHAA